MHRTRKMLFANAAACGLVVCHNSSTFVEGHPAKHIVEISRPDIRLQFVLFLVRQFALDPRLFDLYCPAQVLDEIGDLVELRFLEKHLALQQRKIAHIGDTIPQVVQNVREKGRIAINKVTIICIFHKGKTTTGCGWLCIVMIFRRQTTPNGRCPKEGYTWQKRTELFQWVTYDLKNGDATATMRY
jgi:hypothetical protein